MNVHVLGWHGSASLCRDGQKTKWRLQMQVLAFKLGLGDSIDSNHIAIEICYHDID